MSHPFTYYPLRIIILRPPPRCIPLSPRCYDPPLHLSLRRRHPNRQLHILHIPHHRAPGRDAVVPFVLAAMKPDPLRRIAHLLVSEL